MDHNESETHNKSESKFYTVYKREKKEVYKKPMNEDVIFYRLSEEERIYSTSNPLLVNETNFISRPPTTITLTNPDIKIFSNILIDGDYYTTKDKVMETFNRMVEYYLTKDSEVQLCGKGAELSKSGKLNWNLRMAYIPIKRCDIGFTSINGNPVIYAERVIKVNIVHPSD